MYCSHLLVHIPHWWFGYKWLDRKIKELADATLMQRLNGSVSRFVILKLNLNSGCFSKEIFSFGTPGSEKENVPLQSLVRFLVNSMKNYFAWALLQ